MVCAGTTGQPAVAHRRPVDLIALGWVLIVRIVLEIRQPAPGLAGFPLPATPGLNGRQNSRGCHGKGSFRVAREGSLSAQNEPVSPPTEQQARWPLFFLPGSGAEPNAANLPPNLDDLRFLPGEPCPPGAVHHVIEVIGPVERLESFEILEGERVPFATLLAF